MEICRSLYLFIWYAGTSFEETSLRVQSLGVTRKDGHKCLLKTHTRSGLWVGKLVKLRRHHTRHNMALNIGIT